MTPALAHDLAATVERLRRSTVQVRGEGPGAGSGVIWHADGLIVTNAHVARDAHARVELADGRVLRARVVARDDRRDLSALAVDARGLDAASLGDAASLRPGEIVIALGHPFGAVNAMALGVVHAVDRRGPGRARWLCADVRLAPGNSGGPLADAAGRVVGINTMIAGGLGLAVPVAAVADFLGARMAAAA